jgi:hypothetical protein
MKIINNTEVFEPNECYFGIDTVDGIVVVVITDKETWDQDHCLNDCFGSHSLPDDVLPDFMEEMLEAVWESDSSLEEVKQALTVAGFCECDAINNIAKNYH